MVNSTNCTVPSLANTTICYNRNCTVPNLVNAKICNITNCTASYLVNANICNIENCTSPYLVNNATLCSLTTQALQRPCLVTTDLIIYMALYSLIILFVIAGNIFILVKLAPYQPRRRPNIEVLIIYLSLFDLMSSVMLIVDVYENITCLRKWALFWFGCKIIYPMYHISLNMSVGILIIMSIDRCRSIVTPMKKKFTRRSIHIAVFTSLMISILLQYYQFNALHINKTGSCTANKGLDSYSIPRVIVNLSRDVTFMAIFTVTSVLIYKSLQNSDLLESYPERKKRETRRVINMLLLMECVFTILVVPYDAYDCAMFISRMLPGKKAIGFTDTIYHVDRVLTILQMSNSFANCFIYAKMHHYLQQRSASTSTLRAGEYHGERRETKQECMWSNPAYQQDDEVFD